MQIKQIGMGTWIWVMAVMLGFVPNVRAQQAKPVTPTAPAAEKTAPLETDWNQALPPGQITLGLHFGDQQAESFGDVLVPIYQFKSSLLFISPRGTWNDSDGQEFNLGLGYRYLFPKRNIIVGANLYYDLRNTSLDNTFNQFGAGVEFLSTWFDARVNVYLPENGKKTTDEYAVGAGTMQEQGSYWAEPAGQGHLITQYGYDVTSTYDLKTLQHYQITEQAMPGYDFEVGGLLPIPVVMNYADIKVFGGYYDYNARYGNDISGVKGRLEIRPLPSLYLDASWYEDRELLGSKYSVGARLSVPFDLARLSRGKNPFAGALEGLKPGSAKPAFASRMTEMVVRDLHIRSDVSEPEEVVADRKILEKKLTSTDRKDYNLVLASDVTFVDDDNRSGVENGSWENPYRQINTGVQRAVGTMVYVRDAAQQYYENVVLREGLTLWGSGAPIYGQGNRYLGGIYPVVNGLGRGPAITLASHTTVAGMEITQQLPSYPPQNKELRLNQAGIYGENVTDVHIYHNYIHGAESGIRLYAQSMPSFKADISDNRISDIYSNVKGGSYYGGGISVSLYNVPEVDLFLANNDVTGCRGNGLSIYADGGDSGTFISRISGNYSGNSGHGIYLDVENYDQAVGLFVDTSVNDNGMNGVSANFYNNSLGAAVFASHTDLDRVDKLVNTVLGGIGFLLPLDMGTGFSLSDYLGVRGLYLNGGSMQASGNGEDGIYVNQQSSGVNLAVLLGVQADHNGLNNFKTLRGSGIDIYQSGYFDNADVSIAALVRCEANGNIGSGMMANSSARNLALHLFMDVTANDNYFYGLRSDTFSPDGWAGAAVLSSDPLFSLGETLADMNLGYIPAYGRVQANRNGESGISLDAEGHDVAFGLVLDAQANGNGLNLEKSPSRSGNGVDVNVTSSNGPAIGVVGSSEALVSLVGTVLDTDLSQIRTLGSLQADDNAGNGVSVNAYSCNSDAMVGVLGVEALRNGVNFDKFAGGDGVYIRATTSSDGGSAMAGLAWINASQNANDGIAANVVANSMDGEAMLGGIHLKANDNGNNGLRLNVQSQSPTSAYLVLAGVEANRNLDGAGVMARLGGNGVVMAALTGIQANSNGTQGISVETYASYGDGSNGNSHVWISDTAVQDMIDHGGGFDLLGLNPASLVPAGAIETEGNGAAGIHVNSQAQGNSLVVVGGGTATRNGGNGIEIDTTSMNGHGDLYLAHNTASGNGSNGIMVAMMATNGSINLVGRSNTVKTNAADGIVVTTLAGSGVYDLGTGTGTNSGNNALVGNTGYGLRWVDNSGLGETMNAQNNYWGSGTNYLGNILATPFLADDPSLP